MADGLVDTEIGARLITVATTTGLDLGSALRGDAQGLRPTEIAQPALLLTEVTLAAALPHDLDIVGVAGHSIGEYAACVAAHALTPETAMALVIERGRAMAAMREGTMAAVIGLDVARVDAICSGVTGVVVVANVNAPGQVVISGAIDAVQGASAACREAGARRVMPLDVSGAFHSPLMAEAAARFAIALAQAPLSDPEIPVVGNVDAAAVRDADGIRERLRRQLEAPVRWIDTVATLRSLGGDVLVEVGPGSVLCGLVRRIDPSFHTLSVSTPADVAALPGRLGVAVHG